MNGLLKMYIYFKKFRWVLAHLGHWYYSGRKFKIKLLETVYEGTHPIANRGLMTEHYLYFRALSIGEAYSVSKYGPLVFGSTSGDSCYPLLPTYTQGTLLVSSWNQESLVHFIFQFEFYYDINSMLISFSLSFFIIRSISCKLKFWTVINFFFFSLSSILRDSSSDLWTF